MAFAIPSNSVIDTLIRAAAKGDPTAQKRLDELEADSLKLDQEDYRTVSTERGPVRGYNGSGRL